MTQITSIITQSLGRVWMLSSVCDPDRFGICALKGNTMTALGTL